MLRLLHTLGENKELLCVTMCLRPGKQILVKYRKNILQFCFKYLRTPVVPM